MRDDFTTDPMTPQAELDRQLEEAMRDAPADMWRTSQPTAAAKAALREILDSDPPF